MKMDMDILVKKYKNHLYAAAFQICKNAADAEDVVQETFFAYYMTEKSFESEEHSKAWLLRTAINKAKNVNRAFWRRNRVPFEEYMTELPFETADAEELFEDVMRLPEKYRIVIHLFYYEEYSVREIAKLLEVSEGNVKVRLTRGRKLLKNRLMEDDYE